MLHVSRSVEWAATAVIGDVFVFVFVLDITPFFVLLVPVDIQHSVLADSSILLRGTTLNRTYGTHKKLYISPFLLTIFGPTYYGPP